MAVALLGVLFGTLSLASIESTRRQSDAAVGASLDASTMAFVSRTFGKDVQGAGGLATTPCGATPAGAAVLTTLRASEDDHLITYRSASEAGTVSLTRTACAADGTPADPSTVVDGLVAAPTVACTPSPCSTAVPPRRVTLSVSRTATFSFGTTGARRATVSGALTAVVDAQLLSLGGNTPLAVSGNGELHVAGSIYVNSDGSSAVRVTGNAEIAATGSISVQGGSCQGCNVNNVSPYPVISSPSPVPDPLAYLPLPTEVGLTVFTCHGSTCSYQGPGV